MTLTYPIGHEVNERLFAAIWEYALYDEEPDWTPDSARSYAAKVTQLLATNNAPIADAGVQMGWALTNQRIG